MIEGARGVMVAKMFSAKTGISATIAGKAPSFKPDMILLT